MFKGDLLLQWRTARGFSQAESAGKVNITQEYWHALEHGKRIPSLTLLHVISEVTGIKKSVLLGEYEHQQDEMTRMR
ncbi:MAG: helix-turn-helix domain-containing protein [Synergistaceae bacterium]|nr:helix-turn-helix domain-containing protein [Synergistaceae bacterium]